ncbi:hypothetical protein D187_003105 [Cystobacter fuscus DSM 2262]|uniref:Uncharacterized protein n=1 Tax=Cystobacter fuscus (strain ATCC 25194 / DSM 2262 / NBRC 100088 / M29) TaxID=1242864 RepID=S9P7V1_CYSF2|nr:hypothetical protein D187_003105 [Cystobacter fuscus DSM 2262]
MLSCESHRRNPFHAARGGVIKRGEAEASRLSRGADPRGVGRSRVGRTLAPLARPGAETRAMANADPAEPALALMTGLMDRLLNGRKDSRSRPVANRVVDREAIDSRPSSRETRRPEG